VGEALLAAGEALPDGTVIELLRDQSCREKTSLARYHGGILHTKSEIRLTIFCGNWEGATPGR
jgi:hypothetical protein